MHNIIIIYYKHWAKHCKEDCFSNSVSGFVCHIAMKCDLASSEKDKNHGLFLYKCNMNENFGVKMSQKYDNSMICQTAKDVIADPGYTRLKKDSFFFLLHSNHYYVNSIFTKAG